MCFFFHETLGRSRYDFDIPLARSPKKLPHVLSRGEVARLISGTHFPKHRVLFLIAYSTGLRVSEIVMLRPRDIDSRPDGDSGRQGSAHPSFSAPSRGVA